MAKLESRQRCRHGRTIAKAVCWYKAMASIISDRRETRRNETSPSLVPSCILATEY